MAKLVCADDKPGISNLIEILAVVRGVAPADVERDFADAGGYGDFKRAVGEEVAEWLAPVRTSYLELREDTAAIEEFLAAGAEKAHALAAPVVADVREFMGSKVYDTIIPRNVRISEAPSYGKPVLVYDLKCAGSDAYLRLATEVIQREREQGAH